MILLRQGRSERFYFIPALALRAAVSCIVDGYSYVIIGEAVWYRVGADIVVLVHFLWVVFMVGGGLLTVRAVFTVWLGRGRKAESARRFFGWRVFRTAHVCGILYAGVLAGMGKFCPLSHLENYLRSRAGDGVTYPGSFIVYYVEKIVYPHVEPMMIVVSTLLLAVFVIVVYIARPPKKSWQK